MNKEQKAAAVEELASTLGEVDSVFAIDYRGISVPQAAELRARLRDADTSFRIVKNRLAKRAVEDSGADGISEHLAGPTALAFVHGDAVVAAKAIRDFAREHRVLAYKGGVMEGEPLAAEAFERIARLPGVEALRGQLAGVAASPLTGLARGLGAMMSGLAIALGEISDRGLLEGSDE